LETAAQSGAYHSELSERLGLSRPIPKVNETKNISELVKEEIKEEGNTIATGNQEESHTRGPHPDPKFTYLTNSLIASSPNQADLPAALAGDGKSKRALKREAKAQKLGTDQVERLPKTPEQAKAARERQKRKRAHISEKKKASAGVRGEIPQEEKPATIPANGEPAS
jgi:hypothetical protein